MVKNRFLLKLSGEALSNNSGKLYSNEALDDLALQIKEALKHGVQLCLVCGGGNIYRGKTGEELGVNRKTGDSMGMLATIINALAVSNALTKAGVENEIYTAFPVGEIARVFNSRDAIASLNQGKVVIFGGGTSHPYFSTDTCSALRALECECEEILVAKNGVDGIYSADPKKDKNAVRYDEISYQEILEKGLQVMDLTAISLCKDNNMGLMVFNMNEKNNILNACLKKVKGTKVR